MISHFAWRLPWYLYRIGERIDRRVFLFVAFVKADAGKLYVSVLVYFGTASNMQQPCKSEVELEGGPLLWECIPGIRKSLFQTHFMHGEAGNIFDLIIFETIGGTRIETRCC